MTAFDVPGSITLKDVSRPKPRESWPAAMHRLAAKSVIEGRTVIDVSDDETFCRVTSARFTGRTYRVWIDHEKRSARCECAAYEVNGICSHGALAVASTIGLPPIDTAPVIASYRGRCSITGRTIEPGTPITKSSRGGWMIVDDPVAA